MKRVTVKELAGRVDKLDLLHERLIQINRKYDALMTNWGEHDMSQIASLRRDLNETSKKASTLWLATAANCRDIEKLGGNADTVRDSSFESTVTKFEGRLVNLETWFAKLEMVTLPLPPPPPPPKPWWRFW